MMVPAGKQHMDALPGHQSTESAPTAYANQNVFTTI